MNLLNYAGDKETILSRWSGVDRLSGGTLIAAALVMSTKLLVKQGHITQSSVHNRIVGVDTAHNRVMDAVHIVSGGRSVGCVSLIDALVLILSAAGFGLAVWQSRRVAGNIPSRRRALLLSGCALVVSALCAEFSWPTVKYFQCIW